MIGWGAIGCLGFPGSSAGKESTSNTGDRNLIPGLGRSFWRRDRLSTPVLLGFPGGSDGKESPCNAGDLGWIPGLGKPPGEGIGYLLQYSSHSPWGYRVDVTEQLSDTHTCARTHTHTHTHTHRSTYIQIFFKSKHCSAMRFIVA